jgi:hypothetical protein
MVVTVLAAVAVAWVGGIGSSATAFAAGPRNVAHVQLDKTIRDAIREEGPFFTPAEQKLIAAKCGYAPGEWDGTSIHITKDELVCKNGKRVSDPEVQAMMEVAGPRIGRRVSAAVNNPEVQAAIDRVAHEATRDALARLPKWSWSRGR